MDDEIGELFVMEEDPSEEVRVCPAAPASGVAWDRGARQAAAAAAAAAVAVTAARLKRAVGGGGGQQQGQWRATAAGHPGPV